jgi:hypothetical protein
VCYVAGVLQHNTVLWDANCGMTPSAPDVLPSQQDGRTSPTHYARANGGT